MERKLFYHANGKNNELKKSTLMMYGYFLEGSFKESDKGLLYVLAMDEGATCLIPVTDEKGNTIREVKNAGKYYKECYN